MNVLYDLIYFEKEKYGGISRMWLEYFKLIPNSKISASFIAAPGSSNLTKDFLTKENFFNSLVIKDKIYRSSKFSQKLSKLGIFRNFILPTTIPSDINIFHSTDFINPIFHPKNTKIITTIHDMVFWDQKKSFSKSIPYWDKIWSIYHSLKISDQIITVSNASKKSIIKLFPWAENKIIVNYHGLNSKFLDVKMKIKKQKYFMFMGGRNSYKNYDLLLGAFSKIAKDFPDWSLVVVGENKNTHESEKVKYKSLKISDSVKDYGLIPEEKLIKLLSNTSALVIPSLNEGFNFPLLEALAVGCPVLSSNIPVSKEIGLTHVNYFNNTINSLKDSMIEVIKNEVNKEKLINGQNYAQTFKWEKSFRNLIKVYESCI